jgi:hypothetical protein
MTNSWSRDLVDKQVVLQLVNKSHALCGTWRFISFSTTTCHLSLSWTGWILFMPSCLISLSSFCCYSASCDQVSQMVSFLQLYRPESFSSLTSICATCPAHLTLFDWILLMRDANYEAAHSVVFPSLLLLFLISSAAPCSRTPAAYFLSVKWKVNYCTSNYLVGMWSLSVRIQVETQLEGIHIAYIVIN